jgi:pimeloyl-ACP methyl ester carboxylesterase
MRGGLSRRAMIAGGAFTLLPVVSAFAQPESAPPLVFVHGSGDSAAVWMTQLWRLETLGFPREKLFALNLADPQARADDATPQPGRSSSEEQRRELQAGVEAARAATGVAQVGIIAHSRGGLTARNLLSTPEIAAGVSHLVLCGAPNHGVFNSEEGLGSEFNAKGRFLSRLNGGASEAPAGVKTLCIISDGYDKFAQPEVIAGGKAGGPGPGFWGPALTGAQNLVVGRLDHRELAFSARAFREIHRFVAGREPERLTVVPEAQPVLDGLVTGNPKGTPTNRPLPDATVEIFEVDAQTGARKGDPIHQKITGADGRWGPVSVRPDMRLEFVITAPGHPATHIYRSPFPRSTSVLHLRPARPLDKSDVGAAAIALLSRPRGYFGLPRDVALFDGKEPTDVARGVPSDSISTLRLGAQDLDRPIVGLFNDERVIGRAWPASEGRVTILELTW